MAAAKKTRIWEELGLNSQSLGSEVYTPLLWLEPIDQVILINIFFGQLVM